MHHMNSFPFKTLLAIGLSFALTFTFSSCTYNEINFEIYGSWVWKNSSGGMSKDPLTPQNTGVERKWIFYKNGGFVETDNNRIYFNDSFKLSIEPFRGVESKILTIYFRYKLTDPPDSIAILPTKYLIKRLSDILVVEEIDRSDRYIHTYVRQ